MAKKSMKDLDQEIILLREIIKMMEINHKEIENKLEARIEALETAPTDYHSAANNPHTAELIGTVQIKCYINNEHSMFMMK